MSADNGVYILETKRGSGKEYRVAHLQAVENVNWDTEKGEYTNDPDIHIKNAREMWPLSLPVFTNKDEALARAFDIYEVLTICEYGVQTVKIDREY